MIGNEEKFDSFISQHRWAVLTTLRAQGSTSSSVVAFARDDDELLISTPGFTFKRKTIERDPRVSLCVISNAEPFNFVTVEGLAQIETENLIEGTQAVFANIKSTGYELPEDLPAWLETQQRVIIRITPSRVSGVIR